MPPADSFLRPAEVRLRVALEPAVNALNSLLLLSSAEDMPGLSGWIEQTAAVLSPAQTEANRLVMQGLYFALLPDRSWPSFSAFVEHLAAEDAVQLRDRMLVEIGRRGGHPAAATRDWARVLANADAYLDYLRICLPNASLDVALETEVHALLNRPAALRDLIVGHLRAMWRQHLADEWERSLPLLHESADALAAVPLAGLTPVEAARIITGHDLRGEREKVFAEAREIVFVPSLHMGPYINKFAQGETLWLIFAARLPEGVATSGSALPRSELLTHLGALTDDTRLRILALLGQHDELCAQDIMTRLRLTQSATSRHLRQLSATGYVAERRRDGAKCYSLNRDRLGETFHALERFLGG